MEERERTKVQREGSRECFRVYSLTESELIKLASGWGEDPDENEDKQHQHENRAPPRTEDGTVPGWHQWADAHPQRHLEIVVTRGRQEWQQQQQQNGSASTKSFSVVSWNVLSDCWLKKQISEGDYGHTTPSETTWSFRLQLLLMWIRDLNPDILALQEVDYDKFESDLQPQLTVFGYDGLMQQPKKKKSRKQKANGKIQPCGVATFWKRECFKAVQHASFSRTICVVLEAKRWSSVGSDDGKDAVQKRNRVCIANVHLESSQSEAGADRRARQLNSALSYAATASRTEGDDCSVIVCGDFNTGADSPLFHTIRQHSWHLPRPITSVYEHPQTLSTFPVCDGSFLVPGHHYVIDHMLYAPETLQLVCAMDAFSKDEAEEHVQNRGGGDAGFPSVFCPSDHIPIGAIFEMT